MVLLTILLYFVLISSCKIVRSSVILLLPLCFVKPVNHNPLWYQIGIQYTVKQVYTGHSNEPENVAVAVFMHVKIMHHSFMGKMTVIC